jgi:hypothetical protein
MASKKAKEDAAARAQTQPASRPQKSPQ